MNSQNIFDVFGRQKKQIIDKFEKNIDEKFNKIQEDFLSNQIKTERSLLEVRNDVIQNTELLEILINNIDIQKSYVSFKNRRIVSVNQSIDKNDVVIRKELDNYEEKIKVIVSAIERNEELDKQNHDRINEIKLKSEENERNINVKINPKIEKLRNWKQNVNESLQELLEDDEKFKQKYNELLEEVNKLKQSKRREILQSLEKLE